MSKVIIFSHENDIDGIGSVVLCLLAFKTINYELIPGVRDLEKLFREYIDSKRIYEFDKIFITDLALYNPAIEMVNNDLELRKKVLVFDHHESSIKDGLDKYDFTTIMEMDKNGIKTCGTKLFYEYLCSNGFLKRTKSLDEFVELTRLEDAWEWKNAGEFGQKAHDLAIYFSEVGIENYIGAMFSKLSKNENSFEFNANELEIIKRKKQEFLDSLVDVWNNVEFFTDEFGNYFAAVYANYELRNEISEYVRDLNIDNLKYVVIIAIDKGKSGQKSYRAIEEGFDVSSVAEAHGGNGHPAASSVLITPEQKEQALILRKKNNRDSLEYLMWSSYENK